MVESPAQEPVVIHVARSDDGQWIVEGGGHPAAFFGDRQEACDYANGLIETCDGAAMVVLDEGSVIPPAWQRPQPSPPG